jgi:hypothetical protein
MPHSSTATLLDIWDAQAGLDHVGRALLLLDHAVPDQQDGDPSGLPIGERDRLLLDLRERFFGSQIEALEDCPACGVQLDVSFGIDAIRLDPPVIGAGPLEIQSSEYEIVARLPTSADLQSLRGRHDLEGACNELLTRCVVDVRHNGARIEARDLPEEVQAEISQALGAADPQAEIELQLECASCGHSWPTRFDIVDYFWAEIGQVGRKTLGEVHLLAKAYGWSESEILSLSPSRRSFYLGLVLDG